MRRAASLLATSIPAVILPEGYSGKIMLISIAVGEKSMLVLRAGRRWHREILRDAEAEIRALGFSEIQMDERGGAYLRFEADGSIFLWGRSAEFGACDYGRAAALLKSVWPNRKVSGPFGEMP